MRKVVNPDTIHVVSVEGSSVTQCTIHVSMQIIFSTTCKPHCISTAEENPWSGAYKLYSCTERIKTVNVHELGDWTGDHRVMAEASTDIIVD